MTELLLTNADDGKSFESTVGSRVVVELEENPTTGYSWGIERLDRQIVDLEDSRYSLGKASGIGAGGVRRMTFGAVGRGEASITLKLWRDWEGDASALLRYTVSLKIR